MNQIIKEIQLSLPGYSKDYNYDYLCRDKNFIERMDSQINDFISVQTDYKPKIQKESDLLIEIKLQGLNNIAPEVLTAYSIVNFIAKPLVDPFELVIFDKKTGRIRIEALTEQIENN